MTAKNFKTRPKPGSRGKKTKGKKRRQEGRRSMRRERRLLRMMPRCNWFPGPRIKFFASGIFRRILNSGYNSYKRAITWTNRVRVNKSARARARAR